MLVQRAYYDIEDIRELFATKKGKPSIPTIYRAMANHQLPKNIKTLGGAKWPKAVIDEFIASQASYCRLCE